MKLFAFLPFLLLFSIAFAKYDHSHPGTYKIIEYKFDQTTQYPYCGVYLVLDNGSVWKGIFTYDFHGNLEEWEVGDLVEVEKHDSKKYYFKNLSRPIAYFMHRFIGWAFMLDESNKECFPKVEAIEENGYLLILNDGSRWSVGHWNAQHLEMWSIGERVIISLCKTSFDATHTLYNVDLDSYHYINATQLQPIAIGSDS